MAAEEALFSSLPRQIAVELNLQNDCTVPFHHLINSGNFLHGGATGSLLDLVGSAVFYTTVAQTRGLPLGINVSYLDAAFSNVEIDIGAKVRAVKAVGVATAELKKKSGRIIAQARYSKYIGASSRLKATLPCKL
ncbi:acyl-coenzyme A thioesterase 13-like [Triticum aestivum]|uniref:acyl-coenzyme A thioesterase 13-like n=1 Tax=Triticum aestivum TaxID=4565 RepID=UPI001D007AD4|nr:acyl-coenzyme A thioesterase 13-like [Triticum aestivum]